MIEARRPWTSMPLQKIHNKEGSEIAGWYFLEKSVSRARQAFDAQRLAEGDAKTLVEVFNDAPPSLVVGSSLQIFVQLPWHERHMEVRGRSIFKSVWMTRLDLEIVAFAGCTAKKRFCVF